MADAGYLTIGKVVQRLKQEYPDLTISKVRYLEDEGLLDPSRTPGGYRLYSARDIKRLETILYLQKTRFLPLSVIRGELERAERGDEESFDPATVAPTAMPGSSAVVAHEDAEAAKRLYPIESIPDELAVPIAFVRQLAEVEIIELRHSPHGRDLVDGKDFPLIRACNQLRRFGIEPRNLRQYVVAANRESPMFEQALVGYARRQGMSQEERRRELSTAFDSLAGLTNVVRAELIRRKVAEAFKDSDE